MKARCIMWIGVVVCLGACSDIPTICEDEQGGAIACDLLDMSGDMPPDAMPDLAVEDTAPDLERADMPPDQAVDMCVPMEALQVCNGICGMQDDGCGGVIDCGEPLTSQDVCANACGEQSDGCGGTIACEPCACVAGEPAQPTCGACNLGVSSCDGDTFSCDLYDIPGLDAQTDCDSALLHVNATFDGMMSDGSRGNPFKTIAEANSVAKERGAIAILVGGNENVIYQETLEVQDGVSVVGGWSSTWTVDTMRSPTVTPPVPSSGDLFGARVIDVADTQTLLANLRVITPDFGKAAAGQPGRHNHGLYARNAGKLVMRGMVVQAGKGEDGADGIPGTPGADGQDGQEGSMGCAVAGSVCIGAAFAGVYQVVHDPAQNPSCDINLGDPMGGVNGRGGAPVEVSRGPEDHATDGESAADGAQGGERGNPRASTKNGQNGADGFVRQFQLVIGASGNCQTATFDGSSWTLAAACYGGDGGKGRNGGGGGGGGGASHGLSRTMPNFAGEEDAPQLYISGPDGGSGGAGGCAGSGGQGGAPGGNSVALLLEKSSGVDVQESAIVSISGGAGGRGGDGGEGGKGGSGGNGGQDVFETLTNSVPGTISGAEFKGGKGGNGGNGASGGAGGGGGGGSSFGAYCYDTTVSLAQTNTVQPGLAGAGGESNGESGIPGLSSDLIGCD